ncbi:hypothetical protein PCC21_021770 [Pectobacterium carotovorum subsp. carotovorum PCC21]|nr:hypothetical protein PCC21_021770 [Pectobacterium carotovorum subsp. carotovorum PCC21]
MRFLPCDEENSVEEQLVHTCPFLQKTPFAADTGVSTAIEEIQPFIIDMNKHRPMILVTDQNHASGVFR